MADLAVYAYEKGYVGPDPPPATEPLIVNKTESFAGAKKISDNQPRAAQPVPGGSSVPEIIGTHPRLGFTDAAALRARLLNGAYPERAMLETFLQDSFWATSYVWNGTTAHRAWYQRQAIAFAWLAALDPAELIAEFGTIGVLASYSTASAAATQAYNLISVFLVSFSAGNDYVGDPRHTDVSSVETIPVVYDWCHAAWTSAQRKVWRDALVDFTRTRILQMRPWNSTTSWLSAALGDRIWGNGPHRNIPCALVPLVLANDENVDGALQRDAFATVRSLVFNNDRPSTDYHTYQYTDAIVTLPPAYNSATPNTVRLDGRLGYEIQAWCPNGAAFSEGTFSAYSADDMSFVGSGALLTRSAFVGTPPSDQWGELLHGLPELTWASILPECRKSSSTGLYVPNDGDNSLGMGYPIMEVVGPAFAALAAEVGATSASQLGSYILQHLPVSGLTDWMYRIFTYFVQPWLDVPATIMTGVRARHGHLGGRIIWRSNETAVDGTGGQVSMFWPIVEGYAHNTVGLHLNINYNGQLIIGMPWNQKSGFWNSDAGSGQVYAAETLSTAWQFRERSGPSLNQRNTPATWVGDSFPATAASVHAYAFAQYVYHHRYSTSAKIGYLAGSHAGTAYGGSTKIFDEFVVLYDDAPDVLIHFARRPTWLPNGRNKPPTGYGGVFLHSYVVPVACAPVCASGTTDPTGSGYWSEATDLNAAWSVSNQRAEVARVDALFIGDGATSGRCWITPVLPAGVESRARGGFAPSIYTTYPATGYHELNYCYQANADRTYLSNPTTERQLVRESELRGVLTEYPRLADPMTEAMRLMGWGRVEFVGPTISTPIDWLLAYEYGPVSGIPARTPIVAVSASGLTGAHYQHTGDHEALVWFASDATVAYTGLSSGVTYSWTPSGTRCRHVVANLTPSGAYTATRVGNTLTITTGGSLTASDGGVLSFTTTGSGAPVAWS